jgi:hypothetical protein
MADKQFARGLAGLYQQSKTFPACRHKEQGPFSPGPKGPPLGVSYGPVGPRETGPPREDPASTSGPFPGSLPVPPALGISRVHSRPRGHGPRGGHPVGNLRGREEGTCTSGSDPGPGPADGSRSPGRDPSCPGPEVSRA